MKYVEKAELALGCLSWYTDFVTDLVALFFLPAGLMIANLCAVIAAYSFTIFLYSQRGDPQQCCMAVFVLHIFYDTFFWSVGEGRKHPSLFMMEFVDAVFRSPFSLFLQLTAVLSGDTESSAGPLLLLASVLSSLVQEAKSQCEIENCEHLFRGQLEGLRSTRALLIVSTRAVEIAARQLALAFAQSASGWLGIADILCSAVVVAAATLFDRDSMPSSLVVNFFALPFVNVRGWTTDIKWKPVGLPHAAFYPARVAENVAAVAVSVLMWPEAAASIWHERPELCVAGALCQLLLIPLARLTGRLVQRDPEWKHPSIRDQSDGSSIGKSSTSE